MKFSKTGSSAAGRPMRKKSCFFFKLSKIFFYKIIFMSCQQCLYIIRYLGTHWEPWHSKRCNLLIRLRVVQQNQHILGKNDEYEICRKFHELSKYVKRGGQKGGTGCPQMRMNIRYFVEKAKKSMFSPLGAWKWKGGKRGGSHLQHWLRLKISPYEDLISFFEVKSVFFLQNHFRR